MYMTWFIDLELIDDRDDRLDTVLVAVPCIHQNCQTTGVPGLPRKSLDEVFYQIHEVSDGLWMHHLLVSIDRDQRTTASVLTS